MCGWGGSKTCVAGVAVRRVWLGGSKTCVAGVGVGLGWQ